MQAPVPSVVARRCLGHGVTAVVRALHPGFTGEYGIASYVDAPRLVACASGRPRYRIWHEGSAVVVTLAPGTVLAIAAGCWVTSLPRSGCATFGAVSYPRRLRLIARQGALRSESEMALGDDSLHLLCTRLAQPWDGPEAAVAERALATVVLAECLRCDGVGTQPEPGRAAWSAALAAIEEGCQGRLGRTAVAAAAGVHPNHLARLFRRFGGTTFAQALRAARLQRAQALMGDPRLKLAAVARLSGFASASHLVRCYRLAHGCTPGRVRGSASVEG